MQEEPHHRGYTAVKHDVRCDAEYALPFIHVTILIERQIAKLYLVVEAQEEAVVLLVVAEMYDIQSQVEGVGSAV